MKTELDLIEEYCTLNDAKIESDGQLSPAAEQRWWQLERFYNRLLASRAARKVRASERFDIEEIRKRLSHRDRLRIPLMMDLFFCHRDSYAPAWMENLSTGGAFASSDVALPPGSRMTLYMPNLGAGYDTLYETDVDVVWTRPGASSPGRGMGMRFRGLDEESLRQLDDYIVRFFYERLSTGKSLIQSHELVHNRPIIV
jgi:hypothetical protein